MIMGGTLGENLTLVERLAGASDRLDRAQAEVENAWETIHELEEEVLDELERYKKCIHELANNIDETLMPENIELIITQADGKKREDVCYYAGCISVLTSIAHTLSIDASEYEPYYTILEGR